MRSLKEIAEEALPCEAPGECPAYFAGYSEVLCPNCDAYPAVMKALKESTKQERERCATVVELWDEHLVDLAAALRIEVPNDAA